MLPPLKREAFKNCTDLTSITISDSVTTIDLFAFTYCFKLVEVYNRSSLTITAGSTSNGYAGCYALDIYASNSEKSKIDCRDDGYIFYADGGTVYLLGYNGSDTDLVLPNDYNGKKYIIYQYAFRAHSNITSITIPDNVTSIGYSAFEGCSGLTNITIPDSVTSIGNYAFHGCSSLTSIELGENSKLESICNYAFYNCRSLTRITIPDSVTSIGDHAFWGCSRLTSITIPDSVTSIGNYAFYDCQGFTSITIPDSVTSIGNYAFYECSGLTSITIPNSVTSIGENAFKNCSAKLESITVGSGNTKYHSEDNCLIETGSKTLIHGCKNSIIPSDGSVTSIGGSAFYYCRSLTSITIPDSVTSIGERAFGYCSSLTSIELGENSKLESIGNYAFYNCRRLTSITISDSVTSIGNYAFYDCQGFTSITITDSVTSIGSNAFSYCSNLTNITFENTSGWWVSTDSTATSGTSVDVSDASVNATNLKSTYRSYYWKRSE